MQNVNLNRLLEHGAEPRGTRTSSGERSTPTGWIKKDDNVTAQELMFSNGYKVLAVQIEGQKAVIKGAEAWLRWYEAMNKGHVQSVVGQWLEGLAKEAPKDGNKPLSGAPKEAAQEDDRVAKLESEVTDIKSMMGEILGHVKKAS